MQYKNLGRTGLKISAVGLGCGNFGGIGSAPAFFGKGETEAEAFALMDAAWEMGINYESGDSFPPGSRMTLRPEPYQKLIDDHIQGEIGDILLGKIKGRASPQEITLFKSLGLAVEDLASAHHIYHKALETGLGVSVELGGSRHASA